MAIGLIELFKSSKMNIPTRKECLDILNNNKTPSNVIEHCKTVCKVAEEIVEKLIKNGTQVNKELVIAGALLHDIERAKDDHVIRGANLIKKLGYPEVAEVIAKHTLYKIKNKTNQPKTVEQKIVFYSDKRVKGNEIVSLEERYKDIKERYGVDLIEEFELVKEIGKELHAK